MLSLEYTSYTLDFKFQAKTSRGEMSQRKVWFLKVSDQTHYGVGEVAPIYRLSPEDPDEVPEKLEELKTEIANYSLPVNQEEVLQLAKGLVSFEFPSIRFGLEVALLDLLNGGEKKIFSHHPFSIDIPINGLIWMGDRDFMKEQIKEKLDAGFNCIKLKVGALDFDTEVQIIKELRGYSDELIIRLDANGGFQTNEVLGCLKKLRPFNIHSIEQPILPGQFEAMEIICMKSEIPIALDEELIWINHEERRLQMLQDLKPHYLILKPTLHGGFSSVKNWIDLAGIQGIDWWITSYLESNIGLNAIAQFASQYPLNKNHHGLGTGGLYFNNITSPITIENGRFKYTDELGWGELVF